jgi:hypothetical protein
MTPLATVMDAVNTKVAAFLLELSVDQTIHETERAAAAYMFSLLPDWQTRGARAIVADKGPKI